MCAAAGFHTSTTLSAKDWENLPIIHFTMARRKRVVEDSDDDDGGEEYTKPPLTKKTKSKTASRNSTLDSFVLSSPEKPKPNNAAKPPPPPPPLTSPSPARKRTTTRSTKSSSSTTKSPSASPTKKAAAQFPKEEKTKSADLRTLFSKQAQRSQTAASSSSSTTYNYSAADLKKDALLLLDDILSDPIDDFDDEEIPLSKASSAATSLVGKNAQKRFKEAGGGARGGVGGSQLSSQVGGMANGAMFLRGKNVGASQGQPQPQKAGGNAVSVDEKDSRPWSERFAPADLDELAVHKRKVGDVKRWLDDVYAGRLRQRLLVLKGAAGTGKTTTVKLLAKELKCDVLEWRNPGNTFGTPGQTYQSAASQFEEFLGRGGKFGQLDVEGEEEEEESEESTPIAVWNADKRMILVEEFPNTFVKSSIALVSFRNAILQYLAANMPPPIAWGGLKEPATPIVIVISETLLTTASASADSFTAHRLLGPEILKHPGTGVIEFNPIAPTLLAKALELIVQKEAQKSGRRRTPGPLVLQRLGEIGDIRSAISSLEFLCVKGDNDTDWGSKVVFTKPKRGSKDVPPLTRDEQKSLELVSQRESTLGLFHAIGKVVYNKRGIAPAAGTPEAAVEILPDYMAHLARPKPSEVSVDTLIDETGTDTHTFISALHENYPLSCDQTGPTDTNSSIDYINGCLDSLSESDLLCPSWDIFFGGSNSGGQYLGKDSGSHILRQDEMAFQVAVRGMLFSLPNPVKRQKHPTTAGGGGGVGARGRNEAHKMFYPTYLKLWRTKEELEGLTDMRATKMLKGEFDNLPGPPPPSNGGGSSGAFMFRKGPSPSPSKRKAEPPLKDSSQVVQASSLPPPPPPPLPLLSLGTAARQELILERLPYMAHISRRRQVQNKDLERIVSFRGIGAVMGEGGEEEEEEGVGGGTEEDSAQLLDDESSRDAAKSWATDRPTEEATPRKKRGRRGGGGGLMTILSGGGRKNNHGGSSNNEDGSGGGDDWFRGLKGLEPMQSLVISDDDIEDD